MILCTGSEGFIGKHLVKAITADHLVIGIDPRGNAIKPNRLDRILGEGNIEAIFHLGAISDTTCEDMDALADTNVALPLKLAAFCAEKAIPFIYASSASVYGNGKGALNKYAISKLTLDREMQRAEDTFPDAFPWYGLRFFNVYGPGEEHKGKQASMVHQVIEQIKTCNKPRIFRPDTRRDFVHVDDVVKVMIWMWKNRPASGIYDVGTSQVFSMAELVREVEIEMGVRYGFDEILMPESLVGKYQFLTHANLKPLIDAGYTEPFISLPNGIRRMLE